ncbi:MAG: hypothetical protein WAU36_04060 [Cyclobacteriaceae bacterium]
MFSLFENTENEFNKLDKPDQLRVLDELEQNPNSIKTVVRFLVLQYADMGISIDYHDLLNELLEFYEKASSLDNINNA